MHVIFWTNCWVSRNKLAKVCCGRGSLFLKKIVFLLSPIKVIFICFQSSFSRLWSTTEPWPDWSCRWLCTTSKHFQLCISQCSLTIESILSLQQNKNTHTCKYSKHPTTINKQSISLDQQNYCRNNEKYSTIVLLLKFSFNPVLGPYFLRWSGPLFSLTDHTCQLQNSKKKLENNHQWCNLLESWRTSLCTFQHFTDSNSQVFMLYDFVISFGVTFTEFLWEQKKSN